LSAHAAALNASCTKLFQKTARRVGRHHHPARPLDADILGGLAEFERSLIKARTDVGMQRAREAGIRFGRPLKLTKHQQEQALKLLDANEPQSAVARLLNVDQITTSRLAAGASQAS
jgi:DNA invertase Pin-like site-specific DNA recombinase